MFVNHYGSTEVYTFSIGPDQLAKPGCAGRPAVNTRMKLEPKGEICVHVSSDEAFEGYWNRPDADAQAIRDGWYHTGDTGDLDDDGDLWVDGRLDDMMMWGGENIHPLEVENVLASHPGVHEVAVIGAPDDHWARVLAIVVGDATEAELDPHCLASALPRFKRPREYRFVSALPRAQQGRSCAECSETNRRRLRDRIRRLPARPRRRARRRHDHPRRARQAQPGLAAARDQLSALFAELDRDEGCALSSSPARADCSRRAATSPASSTRSPWVVSQLAHNVAAPERCSKPVIARLQGYVFGVGMELALTCDFHIAADDVQMALPRGHDRDDPRLGRDAAACTTGGARRAKDIVMRGRRVGADEALAIGLVTEVVAADALDGVVGALVDEISRHSPLALAMAKRVLNKAYDGPLHLGLELEGLAYGMLQQTHDFREGVQAFVEKRTPEFDGT